MTFDDGVRLFLAGYFTFVAGFYAIRLMLGKPRQRLLFIGSFRSTHLVGPCYVQGFQDFDLGGMSCPCVLSRAGSHARIIYDIATARLAVFWCVATDRGFCPGCGRACKPGRAVALRHRSGWPDTTCIQQAILAITQSHDGRNFNCPGWIFLCTAQRVYARLLAGWQHGSD